MLLKNGASIHLQDDQGDTAITLGLIPNGPGHRATLLRDAAADVKNDAAKMGEGWGRAER